jgi:putative membrane protein
MRAYEGRSNHGQTPVSAPTEVHSREITDRANKQTRSSVLVENSADRRTALASNRTALAAERTYSAWIRTGLFSLASGVGAKGVLGGLIPGWIILVDSSVLILFSVFCYLVAVWRFNNSGASNPPPDMPRIDARILVVTSGILSAVSTVALLGIWLV